MAEAIPTVIVVDDDPAIRESIGGLLRSVRLQAKLFASVDEFLKAGRTGLPAWCSMSGCPDGVVHPVRGDAAALLVREVDDVETRVMDIVTRSDEIPLFNAMWRIRAQPTGLSVEPILQDHVGAGIIFRRLQHTVLDAGDMGHKGEAVGRIGRDRMRPDRRFLAVGGSGPMVRSAAIGYTAT